MVAALRSELGPLTVRELRQRAVKVGASIEHAVEDALAADEPRAALVALLLQQRRDAGAAADVIPALEAGAEQALATIGPSFDALRMSRKHRGLYSSI